MFRYRLLLALIATVALSSCAWQPHGPTDLLPISCHTETSVGMLFITIENRGNDAGPSTMTVDYHTNSPAMTHVHLEVKTPGIPSGADILLSVDLPLDPHTASFFEPVGKITITVDAGKVLPETDRNNNVLVTGCNDST